MAVATGQITIVDLSDGNSGYNSATIYLYQRETSLPAVPASSLTYTFSTGVIAEAITPWSRTVPAGTDPIYMTFATAISTSSTYTILTGEWSAPIILAQNGADGTSGAAAKSLKITSDDPIFTIDSSGILSPDYITLTASKQNTTGSVTWSSTPSINLYTASTGGSIVGANPYDTVYLRKADFGSNSSITITATITEDSLTDKLIIISDKEGISGYKVFGSNVIKIAGATTGKYLNVSGVEEVDAAWMYTNAIPIMPGESYIVSGYTDLGTEPSVCFYDATDTFIDGSGIAGSSRQTFTTPIDSASMKFSFAIADQGTIKLEKGTVATPYTAPVEEAIPTSANNSLYKWDATNSRWEFSYIGMNSLDSTVVVDGVLSAKLLTANNILTGTLDASKVIVTNLDASNITTGTLNADRILIGDSNIVQTVTDINSAISATAGQAATNLQDKVDELKDDIKTTGATAQSQFDNIRKYIRLGDGKIELGDSSSPITLVIENDIIKFVQNGVSVAQITNNKLVITDGDFNNSLRIGNFKYSPRANGSLDFNHI